MIEALLKSVDLTSVLAIFAGVGIMYRKFVKLEVGLDHLKEQVADMKRGCELSNCRLLPREGGRRFYDQRKIEP